MTRVPLTGALQGCSLHSLLMVTSQALSRSGYGDVQILDRRQSKQRSRFGGHELACFTNLGSVQAKVIVKVIRDTVRIRMLDELSGAVLRTGANLGILVTPFDVAKSAAKQLGKYDPTHIEVIDGDALAELLTKYHIGLRSRGDVDYAFFGGLEEASDRIMSFMRKERL